MISRGPLREQQSRPNTPTLNRVAAPANLKGLTDAELARLATELRAEIIYADSETGEHLRASLGVVELAVAIDAVFDTPTNSWSSMLATGAIRKRC